jgi:IclR family acetate operon transcriptional repressor
MPAQTRPRGRPKSFYDKSAQSRIQALDRALDVLECLAVNDGMTLSEIAADLAQSPATIHRVLSTLLARGTVETDATQRWFIGPAAFRTGNAFLRRTGVAERARPLMRALMEETGETANLGAQVGDEVMFLSQVETPQNIRAFFPPGATSPMHASGIGKALLAHAPEDRIARYLAGPLAHFTDRTIATPDALRAELLRIREQGYSFDDEEKNTGMRCIAAPVFNHHGEAVAGLSVSGPSIRMGLDSIAVIARAVKTRAATLSTQLGAA